MSTAQKDGKVEMEPLKCLNCQESLKFDATYCHSCGQSTKEGRLSLVYVIRGAITNIFNLDTKIFRTFRDLYKPADLTAAFVSGQRRKYTNPAKLFLFSLIAGVSLFLFNLDLEDTDSVKTHITEEIHLGKQKIKWDSLVLQLDNTIDRTTLNKLRDSLFHSVNLDSMYLGATSNISFMGFKLVEYKIKTVDAYTMPFDELINKYKITKFSHKLFIKQYLKTVNNTSGSITNLFKNLSWILLVLLFVMAFVLTVFYYTRNYYYVEHLVLLMYSHSLLFVGITILLILNYLIELSTTVSFIIFGSFIVGIFLTQYFSFKKYYRQGKFITITKLILFNISYILIGIQIIVLGGIITFFVF